MLSSVHFLNESTKFQSLHAKHWRLSEKQTHSSFSPAELLSTQWSIKKGLQAPDGIQEQLQREAIIR